MFIHGIDRWKRRCVIVAMVLSTQQKQWIRPFFIVDSPCRTVSTWYDIVEAINNSYPLIDHRGELLVSLQDNIYPRRCAKSNALFALSVCRISPSNRPMLLRRDPQCTVRGIIYRSRILRFWLIWLAVCDNVDMVFIAGHKRFQCEVSHGTKNINQIDILECHNLNKCRVKYACLVT